MSNATQAGRNIVRRLTASVSSAIAAIAVDGPEALSVVSRFLATVAGKPMKLEETCARFAHWRFTDNCLADEHVMVLVRGPRSVEIHCHGGLAITSRIIEQLQAAGCKAVGDLTVDRSRLVDGDSHDPSDNLEEHMSGEAIQAAARIALQNAITLKASVLLLEQYHGALARDVEELRRLMRDNKQAAALQACDALLQRAKFGIKVQQAWRLTLAGPPNVGKSSLMNRLCGASRVLVHHEPGTTRDAVETKLVIGDWPIALTDTAGIRNASETIERLGIETAWQRWRRADVGLLVVDATLGWTPEHTAMLSGPETVIIVLNKVDAVFDRQSLQNTIATIAKEGSVAQSNIIMASTLIEPGIEELVRAIASHLDRSRPSANSGVPFTLEQIAWLEQQRNKLILL